MRRTTETRLRRAFADVIGVMLATVAGGAVVACGGSTSGPGTLADGGTGGGGGGGLQPEFVTACLKGTSSSSSLLKGLKATPEIDGAVMRTEQAFQVQNGAGFQGGVVGGGDPEDGDAWKASNGETVGALCSKASDSAACLEKVANYRVLPTSRETCKAQYPSSYQADCSATYILYTRGDEIGVARNAAETKALIATFDTLDEALWAASNVKLRLSCGTSKVPDSQYRTTNDGGYDLILVQADNCDKTTFLVTVHVDPAGTLTELSRKDLGISPGCAVAGRRPDGLCADEAADARADAVGVHFATMASLEAASVVAFRRLQAQLTHHGAPSELVDRVRTAARDEIRHARATRTLAKKYGAAPRPPRIEKIGPTPTLFEIALENAREGCVRETFGALVAHVQKDRAADREVRECLAIIAEEETAHAALSWDIAAWIEPQLDDAQRATLARERRIAIANLARDLAAPVAPEVVSASGIPTANEALSMLAALEPVLLAAA